MAVGRFRVEPDPPTDLATLEDVLTKPPHRRERPGERERLADEWISQRLREIDYDLSHPDCQQFADHLHMLGVGTLINLMRQGQLFRKCQDLGLRGLPRPPASWPSEAQRVIIVTVRLAIRRFITHSMPNWDGTRSSISTYFVNYCLFQFKTTYLEYCTEEATSSYEIPSDNVVEMFEAKSSRDTTEDRAIARQTLREVVRLVGCEEFARFVQLTAAGKTRAEIAATMGISVSTLDRRIRRYRQQLRSGGWQREVVTGSDV